MHDRSKKKIFWIAAYVSDATGVNHNGIKAFLVNHLVTFFCKGKPFFSNSSWFLTSDPPNSTILYRWVIENFVFIDEPFAKTLKILETCILVI